MPVDQPVYRLVVLHVVLHRVHVDGVEQEQRCRLVVIVLGAIAQMLGPLRRIVDQYPSTFEEQSVHLEIDYPDVERDLNRWLPLVKWLLAIPHYIVLLFLFVVVFVASILAWFVILVTGSYPRAIFDFIVGVGRWGLRVEAYAFLLVTDRYPHSACVRTYRTIPAKQNDWRRCPLWVIS